MKAIYTNHATNETYTLGMEIADLKTAWNLAAFVCNRMNWNLSMFCNDVTVKLK